VNLNAQLGQGIHESTVNQSKPNLIGTSCCVWNL